MLTYNELFELREKLTKNEITIVLAKELCWKDYAEGKRSWHTKDWKERRANFIKVKCEICSSTETLTLQHISHPKKYYEHEKDVTSKYAQIYIDSNPIVNKSEISKYIKKKYKYVAIPLCPNCKRRHPNRRMRISPHYLCTGCRCEFEKPINRSVDELITTFYENEQSAEVRDKCFVSKEWKNKQNLSEVKYWLLRERSKTKDAEIIEKEAFLLYLNDNIKYLSFEDTITACKKCASYYDLYNLELCPNCKKYYKGILYPTCIQCLPEEKRNAALEKMEFGKEWRAIHGRLGIE